jgi:hypothetical protein
VIGVLLLRYLLVRRLRLLVRLLLVRMTRLGFRGGKGVVPALVSLSLQSLLLVLVLLITMPQVAARYDF